MSLKLDDSNESGSKTRQVKNGETESRMYKKPKKVKKREKKKNSASSLMEGNPR